MIEYANFGDRSVRQYLRLLAFRRRLDIGATFRVRACNLCVQYEPFTYSSNYSNPALICI